MNSTTSINRDNDKDDELSTEQPAESPPPVIFSPQKRTFLDQCINDMVQNKKLYFCIDMEWYERDNRTLLELGITVHKPSETDAKRFEPFHLICQDKVRLRNGRWVPNCRDNFVFGKSERLSTARVKQRFQDLFYSYQKEANRSNREFVIVGHGLENDLKYLRDYNYIDRSALMACPIVDTQKVWTANATAKFSSLEKVLKYLDIPYSFLHNAANDAYYTMQLLSLLCDPTFRHEHGLDDIIGDYRR